MPRKKRYETGGRPPKNPENKVGTPVRCLVTIGVAEALAELSELSGIPNPKRGLVSSDIIRLAVYRFLREKNALGGLEDDSTWDSLKLLGLV